MSALIDKAKAVRRMIIKNHTEKMKFASKYKLEGEIQNKPKLCYILSGYKPYLWDDVFERIRLFQPRDMEVCVASSGKYCVELSDLCKKNGWVYLSTKLNHICVLSNIIMREFPKAEYIFKLDEDIYLPKGYFDDMIEAYDVIEKATPGSLGFICPALPLGAYEMHDFLIKKNCLEEYNERFGKHYVGGEVLNPAFRQRVGVDTFIWEKMGVFDDCADEYKQAGFCYEPCATRCGIAAILFRRKFWDGMGGLKKLRGIGSGDRGDEGQITTYCALNFQMTYCVKHILVGHFAFGGSEPDVLKLKEKHPEYFALQNEESTRRKYEKG